MPDAPRPYRSALREEQSRATRRRIVDAGAALFVARGYGPTTIDAVAERAGVSRRTVFTSVGGKAVVLKLAFDWTIAGDDEPVPIGDRPEMLRLLHEERDPGALVASWIAMNAAIAQRIAPLYRVLVVAADADVDAAELLATVDGQRREGAQVLMARVGELGGLRPGLGAQEAAAIADVLIDPMPYQRLVELHGWTYEAYATQLQRLAVAALVEPSDPGGSRTACG